MCLYARAYEEDANMTELRYDAGTEREELATAMAAWLAAGFVEGWRAERIRRRIGRLARAIGRPRSEVSRELWDDARAIVAADDID
jgi:predicted NAD-dependent protein-ADP-ribosyltransferase YbiA (DUF1768 family)